MEVFARLPVELQREVLSYGTVPEVARTCPGCKNVLIRRQPGSTSRLVRAKFHVTARYQWFCPRCLLIKYSRHQWKCCNPVKLAVTQRYVDPGDVVHHEYDYGSVDEDMRAFLKRDKYSNAHVVLCHKTVIRGLRTCSCFPTTR